MTGNGFTGGIVGNLFTTDTSVSQSLTGLRNNGTVSAGANYKGDTAGDARSLVLGQFFGGIAGYGRGVTLQDCEQRDPQRPDRDPAQGAGRGGLRRKPAH